MSDVNETLQELVKRRLLEMGRRRGRSEPLSLREAHAVLPVDDKGKPPVSYETVRQISKGEHSGRIGDDTADALATMLDVSPSDVLAAAGQRPRLGRFQLPRRADRLNDKERRAVLAVVDAILDAAPARQEPTIVAERPRVDTEVTVERVEISPETLAMLEPEQREIILRTEKQKQPKVKGRRREVG